MRKKHWLIGLFALAALVLGLGSATVLAQESDAEQSRLGIVARMAKILGLEEQQVQDAYDQARQETRDERFEAMVGQRLDALVESGRITQEQADDLREWYLSRPDSFWLAAGADRGKDDGRHKGRSFSGRGYGSHRAQPMSMKGQMDRSLELHVARLLEKGLITQEQADEIRSEYGSGSSGSTFGRGFDRGRGFGRHWGHSFFGGQHPLKGVSPDAEETAPATATPEAPAATPTAPADSSDTN